MTSDRLTEAALALAANPRARRHQEVSEAGALRSGWECVPLVDAVEAVAAEREPETTETTETTERS